MSEDDVLFGYRLFVFDHAARTSVSEACRVFGLHRSTYYVWEAAGGAARAEILSSAQAVRARGRAGRARRLGRAHRAETAAPDRGPADAVAAVDVVAAVRSWIRS
jgi:hypothetical protein